MQITRTLILLLASVLIGCSSGGGGNDNNNSQNNVLTANAGVDLVAQAGDIVNLDGSGSANSNASIEVINYNWTQIAGPTVSLQKSDTATPSFVAPNVANTAEVVLELTVTNTKGARDTATVKVTIIVAPTVNQPPIADAGTDQSVNSNQSVTLDGGSSSDPDAGDSITTFSWAQTAGPNVSIQNSDAAVASFTAPTVITQTVFSFELTVTDTNGATGTDSVDITVSPILPLAGPYVPFATLTNQTSSNGLKVINTQSPNQIITIETDVVEHIKVFFRYDFDNVTQTISNQRPAYVFYWKDNHFWRVSLAPDSDLMAQQVSSESVTTVCEVKDQNHQLNPLQNVIIYRTAGPDDICYSQASDDETKLLRLGFDATEPPLNVNSGLQVFDNGFLVSANGLISFYDINLQNPVLLHTAVDANSVYFEYEDYEDLIVNYSFLQVDGEVRWIDGINKTISNPLHSVSGFSIAKFECDASYCYFVDQITSGNFSIFRIPKDGSGSSQAVLEGIVVNNPQRGFGLLSITTDYIFYAVENASTTKDLYRFPKSPLPTDVPILVDSADDFYFLYSSADSLYYEKMEKSGSAVVNYTAVAINEDLNNSQVYNQSRWVGVANFSYSYENLTPGGNMLLANNYTFIDSGIAGADLQEYDLKTRVLLSTIGEVPGTVLGIGLNIYPKYGDSMIASATAVSASTTSGYQEDIFIINPNTIPVFANLTNTPTLDEKVIY